MKLRNKLIGLCLAATLFVSGSVIWLFVKSQERFMIENAQTQADARLELLTSNMEVLYKRLDTDMSGLTMRSMVQYYFAGYARLLQTEKTQYSLSADGEYLYHIGPNDVMKYSVSEKGVQADQVYYRMKELEVLPSGVYQVYLAEDLSDLYGRIGVMRRTAWAMQGVSAAVLLAVLVALLNRALRPIELLKNQAREIASGQYHLRTQAAGSDEIGQLARSFNKMAEAVEERIVSLTEELERRKLLLGALSHEIKTPMTAVIGYADSLLHMPLPEEGKNACAEKIYTAAKRTEKLSQEMMELISLEQSGAVRKRVFLAEELADGLRILWPQVRIELKTKQYYGDMLLLQSLLSNLIDNAVKASDGQEVTAELMDNCFRVTDRGKGIAQEHLARLTEPFYRADKARSRKQGGVGLGLALCQRIAELHEGTLTIESEEGKGTVVTVRLP